MFEDLKKHITKQNLHQVKKKNRYADDQLKYGHQHIQKYGRQPEPLSDDDHSLSDYELLDRQEAFDNLMSGSKDDGHQSASSNRQNHQKSMNIFEIAHLQGQPLISKYYTPQTRLRELSRQVELTTEKLKLQQQYHQRQIKNLQGNHRRQLQSKDLEIERLETRHSNATLREEYIKQQNRQIKKLKQTLEDYQERINKYEAQALELSCLKADNLKLTMEVKTLHQNMLCNNYRRNQSGQKNHESSSEIEDIKEQLLKKQKQLSLKENQLKQQRKVIKTQQRQLQEAQNQCQHFKVQKDQIHRELECEISLLKKHLAYAKDQLQSVKTEKERCQKSLRDTTAMHSRNLQHMSVLFNNINTTANLTRTNNSSPHKRFHDTSLQFNPQHQQPPSFEEGERNSMAGKGEPDVSPVKERRRTIRAFTHHQNRQRATVAMTSCKQQTQIKNNTVVKRQIESGKSTKNQPQISDNIVINDPEAEQQSLESSQKIAKLQKKLKLANQHIVRLLREKADTNTSTYLNSNKIR